MLSSEIPLGGDSFSCEDWSVAKQYGSTDWLLYGAPHSVEGFLKNLSESSINNLCVKICSSSNILSGIPRKEIIFCILFLFICFLCDPVSNLFDKI